MSVTVTVRPKLLRWGRQRVSLSPDELASCMKVPMEKVVEWEQSGAITLARLKQLATKTHTPLGYLFLHEPPDDSLPIADFRTSAKDAMSVPPRTDYDFRYCFRSR